MDKKKQIEELEKDIAVRMAMAKGVAGSMNNGVEGWLGEYLIEKGWTQIPENAVVLTKEEHEKLNMLAEECIKWRSKYCNTNEICKETKEGKVNE